MNSGACREELFRHENVAGNFLPEVHVSDTSSPSFE